MKTEHQAGTGARRHRPHGRARAAIIRMVIPSRLMLSGMILVVALAISSAGAAAELRFTEPVPLTETVNDKHFNAEPCITDDGLTLYFTSARPGGLGQTDIWVSRRASRNDSWEVPVNLEVVNSVQFELNPHISRDELELWFARAYPSDIWLTKRDSKEQDWPEPVRLDSEVNTTADEDTPCLSRDKLELYFCRLVSDDTWTTYVVRRPVATDEFGAPQLVPVSGSYASLSPDDLIMFHMAGDDFGYKTRESTDQAFGESNTRISDLVAGGDVGGTSMMPDGTLFFSSTRPGLPLGNDPVFGEFGIWQASLVPVISCDQEGGQVRLSWSSFPQGFHLESTATVDGPWWPVAIEPAEEQGALEVSIPTADPSQLFRLKKD